MATRVRPESLSLPEPSLLHIERNGDRFDARGAFDRSFGHPLATIRDGLPDGVHARWSWNGRLLEARTDRYGIWPLFYAATADSMWISDSLVALARALPDVRLDEEAVAVFLRVGFFLGQDTPFRTIRVLPPRGRLTWDGTLSVTGGPFVPPPEACSFDAAVDRYVELFRQAIDRCLAATSDDAGSTFPLSGGRDSRHILFELLRRGAAPRQLVTIGSDPTVEGSDAEIAARVASRLGISHQILVGGERAGDWERTKNEATHFCADEHGWLAPLFAHLGRTTRRSWDGLGGDTLAGGPFATAERAELVRRHRYAEVVSNYLAQVCPYPRAMLAVERALGLSNGEEIARTRLEHELRRFADAANPLSMFFFWSRAVRELALAPFGLGRAVPRIDVPYLDPDLWGFVASLPMDFTTSKALHTEAIRRAFPAHADLPFASTRGIRARRNLPYVVGESAKQAALLIRSGPRHARRGLALELRRFLDAGNAWSLAFYRHFTHLRSLRSFDLPFD